MPPGMKLTACDRMVLDLIASHREGLSVNDVEELLGFKEPDAEIRKAMAHLRHCELITRKTRGGDNRIRWVAK